MIASLHLVRRPAWSARQELWRLRRRRVGLGEASFARPFLPLELSALPPSLGGLGLFAVWPDAEALGRFRRSATARGWLRADRRLALTLEPLQNREDPPGAGPLGEVEGFPWSGPTAHLTYTGVRPTKALGFAYRNARVVRTLRRQRGQLWAAAFVADIRKGELATLSIWSDASAATDFAYGPGSHHKAIAAATRGRYFERSWTARFAVTAVDGAWPGLGLDAGSAANAAVDSATA